jgi:hypothetical protein
MAHVPFRDGKMWFGADLEDLATNPDGMYRHLATRLGVDLPPTSEVAPGAPLPVEMNANRWIAKCPDCNGAEFVWFNQPLFMCASCWNGSVGGKWRRLRLPTEEEEEAVEGVLAARPALENRNWVPGESIEDLENENEEHGLPRRAGGGRARPKRARTREGVDGLDQPDNRRNG